MKKLCLFFVGMFLFSMEGYAESNVDFVCPSEAMIGNKIYCVLKLSEADEKIKGVQLRYKSSDIFSYLNTSIIQPWSTISANSLGIIAVNIDGVDHASDIARTSFMISNQAEVGKSYDIKLEDVKLSNGEKDIEISEKNYSIKILSVHDIISELKINGVSLKLEDGVDSYTVEVDGDSAEIVSSLKKDNYKFVDGYGPRIIKNVTEDGSQVLLKVGTDNQELFTFTLNIRRIDGESQDVNVDIENPQTGNHYLIVIVMILLISCGCMYYSNRALERGRDSHE